MPNENSLSHIQTHSSTEIDLTFYEQYVEQLLIFIENLSFNNKDEAITHIFLLLSSCVELFDNMLYIMLNHSRIGIPILLRAILEASVDIQFILIKKENYNKLKFEDIKLWKGIIEETFNGNVHTAALKQMPGFEDLSKLIKEQYTQLLDEGVRKSQISDRFKETKLADTYSSIYALLCSYTHNGASALSDRHLELSVQTQTNKVTLFKATNIADYEHYLKIASNLIFLSIESINLAFNYGAHEKITEIQTHLNKKNILPIGKWHL